jgi:hypothetical protein
VHAPPFVGASPAAVIGTALQSGENIPMPVVLMPALPALPAVEPVMPALELLIPAVALIIPALELIIPAVALILALVPALLDPVPAFGAPLPAELPVAGEPPDEDLAPAAALAPAPPFDCETEPPDDVLVEPAWFELLPAVALLLFMTDGSFEPQPIRVTKLNDKLVDSSQACWLRDMIKLLEKGFGSRHRDRFPISQ